MKLIIDIPKELYETYKGRPPMLGDEGMDMIAQAIANGTPYEERPKSEWIEIKDRLPEADNDYLVAHLIIDNHYATDIGYFDGKEWYVGDFKTYEVIAWQRLPKPYKRGDENA